MKLGLLTLLVGALASVWSCSSSSDPAPNSNNAGGDSGATAEGVSTDSGAPNGVECTHPGAGKSLGADRCECATTRNVGGEWSAKRTCREGEECPTRNKEERLVLEQKGTSVRIDRGDDYSATGTLCGDVLVWSGGAKSGFNPECGQLRFTDDGRFTSDSCFVASGACVRNHSDGCASQKGQCTGTGAKMPEPAANIQKVICSN
ncbi:MAG: hypothetical protein KF764_05385 [Labilithrix sp.]|nr:hypothetical protein [Labilithrix sp.]